LSNLSIDQNKRARIKPPAAKIYILHGIKSLSEYYKSKDKSIVRCIRRNRRMSRQMLKHFIGHNFSYGSWCSTCFNNAISKDSRILFKYLHNNLATYHFEICTDCNQNMMNLNY
jgi:hypothetical protein